VMRVSSLSAALDYAYGIDAEMMAFDREGKTTLGHVSPICQIFTPNPGYRSCH
jgi:hypothetical protein